VLREVRYYSQLAAGVARWAREPIAHDPSALVRDTIANRERNFLALVRDTIFAQPTNPFHTLLRWAGCSYPDLEELVRREGLETALERLLDHGVYLTHDEFKGRHPVVRGSSRLDVDSASLANPLYEGSLETSSSGSRSRGTVTRRSLEYQIYREAQEHLFLSGHGVDCRDQVVTTAVLPATGGLRRVLTHARRGQPAAAWFAMNADTHYRALTRFMILELRCLGIRAPFPQYLPTDDFSPVARWIADRKNQGIACLVTGNVSPAVRIVAAALEQGHDISGTSFVVGGEALTAAKLAVMHRAGCEAHARYTISEFGPVGFGCREMEGNCVHLCRDSLAVISRRRVAPLSDTVVDSLLFTPLLPFAPTVGINLEMDDAGTLGPTSCGCPLNAIGLDRQVDAIVSYGKLTGHGTSLMGGDVLQILESALPARFGGVPSDYQLVEKEGVAQTEIELRVHPRLQLGSEDEVRRFFLAELSRLWSGSTTRRMWTQSGSIRVTFAAPLMSGGRKVLPLHLLGSGQAGS